MTRKPIIIGNWKMHKTVSESVDVAAAIQNALGGLRDIEVGIAPVYTALHAVAQRTADSALIVAAQNCHAKDSGAYTGEIALPMIKDVGCSHVLIGHSERRQYFGETDQGVNEKVIAALAAGLVPVMCIGELLSQREAGNTFSVVEQQLLTGLRGVSAEDLVKVVVAYEPVWAIGTGKTATNAQAQEVHQFLREKLRENYGDAADAVRIQYGGSVKPANIDGLMQQPDIDGALVGGASLDAESFIAILKYKRGL